MMPICRRLAGVRSVLVLSVLMLGARQNLTAAEPGPKSAEFDRVFVEWKALLRKLLDLKMEYSSAEDHRQAELKSQYERLVEKGEAMLPGLIGAAQNAYREVRGANEDLAMFLTEIVSWQCCTDQYEEALKLAQLLLEHQTPDSSLGAWAGLAAFAVGDFDASRQLLKLADEEGALRVFGQLGPQHTLAQLPQQYPDLIAYYEKEWPREQQLRAAEAEADDLPRVLLKTNKGDIELELFENEAPNTVANFISLVEKGFYDGLTFHRVFRGFLAQGGDPPGDGTGGPGYSIPSECVRPDHRLHFRGSLSMARAGPDTDGSQFFVNFVPTRHLDGNYTVFGRVVQGMEVLSKLRPRDPQEARPPAPDKIIQARVLRKRDHAYQPKKVGQSHGEEKSQAPNQKQIQR